MAAFSTSMRKVAQDLIKELGNACTLTKVTYGEYDPDLGETPETEVVINTYSAPTKNISVMFGQNGQNTNLNAFDSNKVTVPWINQEIDSTWKYNGYNILTVEPIEAQNDIIVYTITVGEK